MSVTELNRLNKDNAVHLSVKALPIKYVTSHQVIIMFTQYLLEKTGFCLPHNQTKRI